MIFEDFQISPWEVIIFIADLVGFTFSFALYFKRKVKNIIAGRFLSLFLFTISILLFSNLVVLSKAYKSIPDLIGISFLHWYVMPPTFYFYVKYGIYNEKKLKWSFSLHYITFLIMLFLTYEFYLLEPNIKLDWFENYLSSPKTITSRTVFIVLYSFTYLGACIFLVLSFERTFKKISSNTKIEHIDGIKLLIAVYLIYKILDLIGFCVNVLSNQETLEIIRYISISLTIFIGVIAFTYLSHPEKLFQTGFEKIKYKSSPLSVKDLGTISAKLESMMMEEKVYLESEINLRILAEKLNTTTHELSQVINQKHKINFYEFINKYRIEEVKLQLVNPKNKHLTILGIAFKAGFNSKSSFNKIFKNSVGMSPSQFIKKEGK